MISMKDFFKTINRYKVWLLIELALIIIFDYALFRYIYGTYWFDSSRWDEVMINGARLSGGYRKCCTLNCLAAVNGWVTTLAVLCATLIRYVFYENKNLKLLNASFPMKIQIKTLHELLLGGIPITFAVVFWGFTNFLRESFDFVNGGWTVWNPSFQIDYLYSIYIYLAIALDLYVFMVFAKSVASTTAGLLLNYIVTVFLAMCGYAIYVDYSFEIFKNQLFLYNLINSLLLIVPLIFCLVALPIADKKLDISKGGVFHFKSVQVAVSIFSGLSFFGWMLGFIDVFGQKYSTVNISVSIIISLAISLAIFFLTRARKA